MEQIGLALILFAAFWVGCAAGYIAMRLRAQVAYEKGRNESAAEISALTERLNGRDLQFTEARQRGDSGAETITRLETELRAETDRRTIAEARLTLLPKYEAELETRGKKLAEQQAELTKLHVSASELSTRLEETKRTSEDKIHAIQALQSRVTESFQTMSAEALMTNNKAFLDLAGDALTRLQESARGDLDQRQSLFGQIMEPLKSSLDRVDSRISELERDRVTAYAGLQEQVESMMRTQVSLQAETSHLASALRTPSSRGRWGEVQLRRVVELAGMISHCDFIEPRATEEAGTSGRPDLIVQLPNFRQIVVDSKVSLAAYLESNDATDEASRLQKRREHAAGVRAHVTQLSAKGYWDQFPQSPEFVIAFLPGESFFSAALEHDPELLEFGVERRVILATPTTLIALLRAVAWGWKQEMVSSNAREIRDLGKALYDRLRSLADNFTEVQRGLSRTTAAFNRTVGTFESSVIPSARRLRELGASTGDEIVSPPPVDSTPRSLQLLAEATEPAPAAESETFDGGPTPLAKIGVTPAGAQPRGLSSRQAVEPATAKTAHPVPVNHTAFDQQKPNGVSATARTAEPVRPPTVAPAAQPGTSKLFAPAPTPEVPKPVVRNLPTGAAEVVKPAAVAKPAAEPASNKPAVPHAFAISATKPAVAVATPQVPAEPIPSVATKSTITVAEPVLATMTAAPPTSADIPAITVTKPAAEPVATLPTSGSSVAEPVPPATTPAPPTSAGIPEVTVGEPATEPVATLPTSGPSVAEPVPPATTAAPPTSAGIPPVTVTRPAAEPVDTLPARGPSVAEPVPPATTAAPPTSAGIPPVTVTRPAAEPVATLPTRGPSVAEPVPPATTAAPPTSAGIPPVTVTRPAAEPVATLPTSGPSVAEPVPPATTPAPPTSTGIPPIAVTKPAAEPVATLPTSEPSVARPAVAVAEPVPATATAAPPTSAGIPPITVTKPAAEPVATLPTSEPSVAKPAFAVAEPAPATTTPAPPTSADVPAITATKPVAESGPAPPNSEPAASSVSPVAVAIPPAPHVSEPVAPFVPAPVAAKPAITTPVASAPEPVAAPAHAASSTNEPSTPITFVLSTLPAVSEEQEPLPPPTVESAAEPAPPASAESLKALAALYSSKPNGTAETAEPRVPAARQTADSPVSVAS